jgi:hypothetical protein
MKKNLKKFMKHSFRPRLTLLLNNFSKFGNAIIWHANQINWLRCQEIPPGRVATVTGAGAPVVVVSQKNQHLQSFLTFTRIPHMYP